MGICTYDKLEFPFVEGLQMMWWHDLVKAFVERQKLLLDPVAPTVVDIKFYIFTLVGLSHLPNIQCAA